MIVMELPNGIRAVVDGGKWHCTNATMQAVLRNLEPITTGYFMSEDDKLARTAEEALGAVRLPSPDPATLTGMEELPEGAVY